MLSYAIPFLLSLLLSFFLTPMIIKISNKYGFIVEPRKDRWHKKPTPLLGGIDIRCTLSTPDILGNSRDPATVNKLKEKLNGREVNLLYIDGEHTYEAVKGDYERYSPLVKNIIVIHDIVLEELKDTIGKFWNELIAKNIKAQNRTFITLKGYCNSFKQGGVGRKYEKDVLGQGTGLILLEDLDVKYV